MSGRYSFQIEQGATFTREITWRDEALTPVDLTGYTAKLQAKSNAGVILLEMTTENDYIILGGVDGTVTLTLPASITANIEWSSANYHLELYLGSTVKRLLRGVITIDKEIVKA